MELAEAAEGSPPTEALYWKRPYEKEATGNLIRVLPDEKKYFYLILDATLFHPKGGGQPSDKGFLTGDGFRFEMKKAMLSGQVVVHWGRLIEGEAEMGPVRMTIDWDWRWLLMRRHTGGHLLDDCMARATNRRVETLDSWLGDPCYVAYRGESPSSAEVENAEQMENRMIRTGARVEARMISWDELLRVAPDAPNMFRMTERERVRLVQIEGCSAIPCGGTHVSDIREIGGVRLERTEKVQEGFRVYYDIVESSD